ncbi:hypothetical protein Hs30E_18270 [Lactococcus hodotermopsidis]|uniref:Uncharacterized protein n=1 Tax=Pseudolactococcus hodotermopsidis TaxID=2709157 RepID=A0A6A0BES8_9LACT|nr:hypothetical protein [Lactococcus hodotermopsidis]GFH43276.1 hypothetical protein Hs30E_18270 [Lactococcus hodotermopsidis]
MKKLSLALFVLVVVFGATWAIGHIPPKMITLSQSFDTSAMPIEVFVGENGQFLAPYQSPVEYDLTAVTTFSSSDETVLKVTENGAWQALKSGTVMIVLGFELTKESYRKYRGTVFAIQENARIVTVRVVERIK